MILFMTLILASCVGSIEDKQKSRVNVDTIDVDTSTTNYSSDADMFTVMREYNITLDNNKQLKDSLLIVNKQIQLLNKEIIKYKEINSNSCVDVRENLAVAEYKLLRIREYNRIAKQGNNIKFLRGWIIRVLDK